MVYQIISGSGNHTPQFDEQLRLIRADTYGWACEKAGIMGHLLQDKSTNAKGEELAWKFVNVVDVVPLPSWEDGDEIYSTTSEPKDVKEYLADLSVKTELIFNQRQ